MKKLILLGAFCATVVFADMMISPDTLPANIKSFVQQHFKGAQIMYAERDMNSYDIGLSNGVKIEFNINGEWVDVDGKFNPLPTTFLPQAVANKVRTAQPNAAIIDIDRTLQGYKFKFNNGMKVYTDANGNILGQKFDD